MKSKISNTKQVSSQILLDTNAIIYLCDDEYGRRKFGQNTRKVLNDATIVIPQIAILELDYLHEINRISLPGKDIVSKILFNSNSTIEMTAMITMIDYSNKVKWTRDPFDRLIVATSIYTKMPLLTADAEIIKNYKNALDLKS